MIDDKRDELLRRISEGESLRSICADKGMPSKSTVFAWLGDNVEFREQYARAREAQAETLAHEILEIADTPLIGSKTTTKADGSVETVEGDMIEHRRLQVDARKWMAARLAPKKYGDAATLRHADANGERIKLDETQMAVRLAALVASIRANGE